MTLGSSSNPQRRERQTSAEDSGDRPEGGGRLSDGCVDDTATPIPTTSATCVVEGGEHTLDKWERNTGMKGEQRSASETGKVGNIAKNPELKGVGIETAIQDPTESIRDAGSKKIAPETLLQDEIDTRFGNGESRESEEREVASAGHVGQLNGPNAGVRKGDDNERHVHQSKTAWQEVDRIEPANTRSLRETRSGAQERVGGRGVQTADVENMGSMLNNQEMVSSKATAGTSTGRQERQVGSVALSSGEKDKGAPILSDSGRQIKVLAPLRIDMKGTSAQLTTDTDAKRSRQGGYPSAGEDMSEFELSEDGDEIEGTVMSDQSLDGGSENDLSEKSGKSKAISTQSGENKSKGGMVSDRNSELDTRSLLYDDDFEDEGPGYSFSESNSNSMSDVMAGTIAGERLDTTLTDAARDSSVMFIQCAWRCKTAIRIVDEVRRHWVEKGTAAAKIQNVVRSTWAKNKAQQRMYESKAASAAKIQGAVRRWAAKKREAQTRALDRDSAVRIQSLARMVRASGEVREVRHSHHTRNGDAAVKIQTMVRRRKLGTGHPTKIELQKKNDPMNGGVGSPVRIDPETFPDDSTAARLDRGAKTIQAAVRRNAATWEARKRLQAEKGLSGNSVRSGRQKTEQEQSIRASNPEAVSLRDADLTTSDTAVSLSMRQSSSSLSSDGFTGSFASENSSGNSDRSPSGDDNRSVDSAGAIKKKRQHDRKDDAKSPISAEKNVPEAQKSILPAQQSDNIVKIHTSESPGNSSSWTEEYGTDVTVGAYGDEMWGSNAIALAPVPEGQPVSGLDYGSADREFDSLSESSDNDGDIAEGSGNHDDAAKHREGQKLFPVLMPMRGSYTTAG